MQDVQILHPQAADHRIRRLLLQVKRGAFLQCCFGKASGNVAAFAHRHRPAVIAELSVAGGIC